MFKNLTIRTRLVFILSILVAFLLGIQMLGLVGMSNAIGGLETVYHDRAIPLNQVSDVFYDWTVTGNGGHVWRLLCSIQRLEMVAHREEIGHLVALDDARR